MPSPINERFVHAEATYAHDGSLTYRDGWDVTAALKGSGEIKTVHYNNRGDANFEPYAARDENGVAIRVEVKATGDQMKDVRAAWRILKERGILISPVDYTAHHEEFNDEDGNHTMLFVQRDVHNSFQHSGSFAESKADGSAPVDDK